MSHPNHPLPTQPYIPQSGTHRQPATPMQLVQTSPHWSFVFRNIAVGVASLLVAMILTYGVVVAVRVQNAARQLGNTLNEGD